MIQEDKNILIKDLCARLPYGVVVQLITDSGNFDTNLGYIIIHNIDKGDLNAKPYLFPLSSMTEEQKAELATIADCNDISKYGIGIETHDYDYINIPFCRYAEIINYLNQNHFDYNRLIDKGLAIDCTNLNIY